MSRVIIFSQTFPAYHPKSGQPTFFVEKIYNYLFSKNNLMDYPKGLEIDESITGIKKHTIRAGHRWKIGNKFSPRVWSGRPYASKQIIIAPDIEIKKIWNFEIEPTEKNIIFRINGTMVSEYRKQTENWFNVEILQEMAKNDGLDTDDFFEWFDISKPFSGQIICWNESVNY